MRGAKAKALRRIAGAQRKKSELQPLQDMFPRRWAFRFPRLARLVVKIWRHAVIRIIPRSQWVNVNQKRALYKTLKKLSKTSTFIPGPMQIRPQPDGRVELHHKKTGCHRSYTLNELRRMYS